IKNVTNYRVNSAVQLVNWINYKNTPKTVGRMRDLLQNPVEFTDRLDTSLSGINPQDWWDLETVVPYTVEITWSSPSHAGDYDVQFIRHGIEASPDWVTPRSPYVSWTHYANDPLQSQFARQLIPELRQHLKQTLPDYMVPSAFMPLAALPLTVNGKVDRHALPSLHEEAIRPSGEAIAPSTQTELTLTEIWQDLLRLKQVNSHDNFFELGGHSLLATQMTSRVRDAFGLELPLKSVFEAPTIAQLAPILDTLRDNNSTTSMPPLVRLERSAYRRKRSPLPAEHSSIPPVQEFPQPVNHADVTAQPTLDSRSPLVPLTLGNSQSPFFCVHPMFGVVFPYLELAHHLRSDRSFYGLQPLGLDGQSTPLNRIEAIAAYYIQAIQTRQPQGPYFLGGWSFGGLVAFEMAQQLLQAGHQVGLLAILDTTAPGHKLSFCQSLKFLLGTAVWSTLPFLLDYSALATTRLQSWNAWFSRWQWSAIARLIPEESRLQVVDESAISPMLRIVYANAQAAYRYVPQPYGDRITLFKAVEQIDTTESDPTLGWGTLANDIQLHDVPGNHLSLLKQPHVQILAQQLDQYLA
ncbi:MAG TPA: thioesterase domain-containing protein, partial [Crinalium sp.]